MSKLDDIPVTKLYEAFDRARSENKEQIALALALEIKKRTGGIVGDSSQPQYEPVPAEMPKIANPKEYYRSFREAAERGMSLGALDYTRAIGSGVKGLATGEGFLPAYKKEREETKERRQALREATPASAALAEFIPAALTGYGIGGLAARGGAGLGTQMLLGSAEGATAGALTTDGTPSEKLAAAGVGAGLGAAGTAVGALVPRPTQAAIEAQEKGIRLTAGQKTGGLPKFIEETIQGSIFDIPVGVGKARMKGFEDFNRMVIQDATSPIGVSFSKDLKPDELFTEAVEKTNKAFSDAVDSVKLERVNPIMLDRKALSNKTNKEIVINKFGLNNAEFEDYLDVIDRNFYSSILPETRSTTLKGLLGDKPLNKVLTGRRLSNALSKLNTAAQDAFEKGNKNLSNAIKNFQSSVLDEVERNAENPEAFLAARQAWSKMTAIKDAARGRDIITPGDYKKALESRYGATYRSKPEYQKMKPIMDVIGEGAPVSDFADRGLVGLQTVQGASSTAQQLGNIMNVAAPVGAVATGGSGLLPAAAITGIYSGAYRLPAGQEFLGRGYGLLLGRGAEGVGVGSPLLFDEITE